MTMNVDLPADASQFVEGLVASGEYSSADEVVVQGIRLLMTRQQLRDDIQQGLHELDAGQGIDGKEVFSELRARAAELSKLAE